jgi:hypothetical protein
VVCVFDPTIIMFVIFFGIFFIAGSKPDFICWTFSTYFYFIFVQHMKNPITAYIYFLRFLNSFQHNFLMYP